MVSHDRHLLDACVDGDRRARQRARSASGPAPTPPTPSPASSSSSASSSSYVTQQKEIARLEEAVRRFRHWAHIRVNERAAKQARVKQMQIDRMEKVDRPGARAPQDGARAAQRRRAAASACSRSRASTSRSATTRCCSTSSSWSRAASASASSAPTARGKTALLRMLAGELDAGRAATRWAGAGHRGRLPLAGRGRAADDATVIDALRAGRSMAEDTAVRLLMALPVRLRAGPPPGRHALAAASARGSRSCC